MENFDKVFTIEILTSKAWEVVGTYDASKPAIQRYEQELEQEPIMAVRLTSPTDLTIYG